MASSDSGGGGAGLADSSVGSIVWVRRRNGSWWPGKILGPDELSATHVMSPRSGTPVKLLGREDASVDWYNLEKSKRVKAFRCGDFDDCIERAEASQGMPPKKREKYARREDAILHALELEKQLLDKKYGNLGTTSNSMNQNSSDSATKDLPTSGTLDNGTGNLGNQKLHQVHKKVDSYNENECNSNPLYTERTKDGARPSLEQDNSEVSPRTRGLLEFGCRAAPDKPMDSLSIALNGGEHSRDYSNVKKSRVVYLQAEFSNLADTKEGPHSQMQMPVPQLGHSNLHPHRHPGAFVEQTTSRSSEDTESDSSETDSMEQDVDAEMTTLSDSNANAEAQSGAHNRLALQRQHESTSSEELDVSSADDASHFHFHNPVSSSMGFSKWKLKGKRNIRNLTRRSMGSFTHGMYLEGRRFLNQMTPGHSLSYYHDNNDYINEVDIIEDDTGSCVEGFGKRGYLSKLRGPPGRQNFLSQKLIDWEELTWGDRPFRGYLDERSDYFNPAYVGRHGRDMLIDVDLKVQANHQGEHVPWVSLMSKLNGKAIIGHPIQIETLEDGSTDAILSTTNAFFNCGYDDDGNRVPPVWSTARRTANFRVPRPYLLPQPDGDDPDNQYFDHDRNWQFKKSAAASSVHKQGSLKKSLSHVPRPPPQRMKKPLKKMSLSASQKTRTLSSIGNNQKLSHRPRDAGANYCIDGVIKPLVSGPPTVACIPVKLVFSRLLEAVGRPPSGPTNHGVLVNSNKERNPS
ncbi:hypothetical protein Ancab_009591 [Ancistrocladus abbreviatus]